MQLRQKVEALEMASASKYAVKVYMAQCTWCLVPVEMVRNTKHDFKQSPAIFIT